MTDKRTVFVVQHEYESAPGRAEVKFIGAYSTRALARRAVNRLRKQPGFCDTPDAFSVDEYEMDRDHWVDGFVAMKPAHRSEEK